MDGLEHAGGEELGHSRLISCKRSAICTFCNMKERQQELASSHSYIKLVNGLVGNFSCAAADSLQSCRTASYRTGYRLADSVLKPPAPTPWRRHTSRWPARTSRACSIWRDDGFGSRPKSAGTWRPCPCGFCPSACGWTQPS